MVKCPNNGQVTGVLIDGSSVLIMDGSSVLMMAGSSVLMMDKLRVS